MPLPDEIRTLRLTVHKNAYGKPDYARLGIPVSWLRALGITDTTDVKAELYLSERRIVIHVPEQEQQ